MTAELPDLLRIGARDVVAVVGAGGKHTLMARLADDLPAAGRRVVLTSTTNLHRSAVEPLPLIRMSEPGWEGALATALDADHRAVVVDRPKGPGMEVGLAPEAVPRLSAAAGDAAVIVKADGARKRLLKAPGPGEPSLPPGVAAVVVVCSLAALGRPLDDAHVHRPEVVRALAPQDPLTAETIVTVATAGYAPHVPPGARATLYLCHAVDEDALDHARAIAAGVGRPYASVVAADTIDGRFHLLS